MPSAPPGGTAAEEEPGQGQYPDDDGNCIFAGGDHGRLFIPATSVHGIHAS